MLGIDRFGKPSVMDHDFSRVPHADIPRSSFRRSHSYKTTLDVNYIYPIYMDEALPGDTFNVNLSSLIRLNTPLFPIMDNLTVDYFFFAVPNRLLWTNWKRFMGERDPDPDSSIDYTVPVIDCPSGGWTALSLADYFGIPPLIDNIEVNALHFRAYNLIYNTWFRDQNLIDSVQVDVDDGPDDPADYVLLKRGKRHDYFTSCLPWPQKGDEIELPLGERAPIYGIGVGTQTYGLSSQTAYETDGTGSTTYANARASGGGTHSETYVEEDPDNSGFPNIWADLSTATASTINSLREAFQLQKLLERDARGGTRYIEIVKSHFGVTSPDFRMQRPEYLGGGSRPVIIDPVASTSFVSRQVGELGAYGYQSQSGIGFTKSFTEHCVILGLINIRADLNYQQGLNRMWRRQTRYDYFWPSLSFLGEQEVLNSEIYLQDGTTDTDTDGVMDNDEVFGYQERWAEYRYKPSLITGQMRSQHATPLDVWHLAQEFSALPSLNQTFIEEDVPIDRVVADSEDPAFYFDGFYSSIVTRPMPMYSVPGMIDHF